MLIGFSYFGEPLPVITTYRTNISPDGSYVVVHMEFTEDAFVVGLELYAINAGEVYIEVAFQESWCFQFSII